MKIIFGLVGLVMTAIAGIIWISNEITAHTSSAYVESSRDGSNATVHVNNAADWAAEDWAQYSSSDKADFCHFYNTYPADYKQALQGDIRAAVQATQAGARIANSDLVALTNAHLSILRTSC